MATTDLARTESNLPKQTSRWAPVGRFVLIALVGYVGVLILFYAIQRAMLFPGGGPILYTPEWAHEEIYLDVEGGTTHAWYSPVEGAPATVIMSHGNGENISTFLPTIELFRNLGYSTLAYDYGGYGNSTGSPSEVRCYADITTMYEWLIKEKGVAPENIAVYGRSLGGGPSTYLATQKPIAALILESTFTSVPDAAAEHFPWLPVRMLARDRFPSIDRIAEVDAPVLIIHSPDDTLIPFSQGRRLFEAATEPKTFLEIQGDHNEGFYLSGDKIEAAIREHLASTI